MLTWSGRILGILAVLLLLAGAAMDYPELVTLGLACLLAVLAAGAWMLVRPAVVAVRAIDPPRVTEGDQAQGVLTLTNEGRHRSPPVIAIEHVAGQQVVVPLPSLSRAATHSTTYSLPTGRRGVFAVGPLTIGHSDPLMLMHAASTVASTSMLTVHPRVHKVAPLPAGRAQDIDGPTTSSAPRGGIAFHQISEYAIGDDPRLIHWLSTAKAGKLMVRHNVVPNEPRLMVVLDANPSPYTADSFEDAIRAAASLCMAACVAGYPLSFRTTGGISGSWERGQTGREAMLDVLASVERDARDPGLKNLSAIPTQHESMSLAVITGKPAAGTTSSVAALRNRFQMVSLIQIGEAAGSSGHDQGVLTITAASSEEFAAAWNRQVRS